MDMLLAVMRESAMSPGGDQHLLESLQQIADPDYVPDRPEPDIEPFEDAPGTHGHTVYGVPDPDAEPISAEEEAAMGGIPGPMPGLMMRSSGVVGGDRA